MSPNRRTLAFVALLAGVATALVVHAGEARTTAQRDALVALRHPQTVTAVQRGETLVAIAPQTRTVSPSPNIGPPASDANPIRASNVSSTTTTTTRTTATATATTATTATDVGLPKVGHVFLISLSTASETAAFARDPAATYLRSLLSTGTLLAGYGSLGHGELADQLALVSGQPPNPATTAGCPKYTAFPATASPNAAGLVAGVGCVYPDTALSLADQVSNAGQRWGGYVEGMGTTPCPTPQTGGREDAAIPTADADYDTIHNPFIFFPSLTGSGDCYLDEGDTGITLAPILRGAATGTPSLTYIAPGTCADGARADTAGPGGTPAGTGTTTAATGTTTAATGTATAATTGAAAPTSAESATAAGRDAYCAPGQATGIPAEDEFLQTWVPQILASKAYQADGVLVIAFSGVTPKQGHRPYRTGALVMSRWTPKGRRIAAEYDPYSMLHSIEDMLDLQPLANAAEAPAFATRVL